MTREEARAAGRKTFQGRPCANGHHGERYVLSDGCCECAISRSRNQRRGEAPSKTSIRIKKHQAQHLNKDSGRPYAINPGFNAAPIRGGCRFPLWGHDEAPTHEYCGARRREASPYCAAHHAICYVAKKREGAA